MGAMVVPMHVWATEQEEDKEGEGAMLRMQSQKGAES